MSQTDLSSSFYDGIDNLNYLPSDNAQIFTPDLSISQRTEESFDPEFLQPSLSPAIPPSLERVGSDHRKPWILYNEMVHNDWVTWWLETDFGKKSNIKWSSSHSSSIWDNFHQVVNSLNGALKVMCKRCGAVLEHPYTEIEGKKKGKPTVEGVRPKAKKNIHGLGTMTKHPHTVSCLKDGPAGKTDITKFLVKAGEDSLIRRGFSQELWEETLLTFLTVTRLPFQLIEHPQFQALIRLAQTAPFAPQIPSAKTIRRRLQTSIQERQQGILRRLPENAKLSIALDCWTSPFAQAFLAISGYFIDGDWEYREVLLGFEPLQGNHTGSNLSNVLFDILRRHEIDQRVFAITTDNASNNKTLMTALQQAISDDTTLIRVPCLAHVIQLSLNELLGHIKAVPINETTERQWTEERSQSARDNAKKPKRDIARTLEKIRNLAVFTNASAQRRDAFYALQPTAQKLVPIQDVKTRWNSTFLMLRRAKRLRSFFPPFCTEWDRVDLVLDDEEWRQVDYLLLLTEPFFDFTLELSKTKDVTAHYVFRIYNKLFEHLEKSISQLRRKRSFWKKQMLKALEAARTKLDIYYSNTDNVKGHLYAVSTMLAFVNKFKFFLTKDWNNQWRETYRKALKDQLIPYQERITAKEGSLGSMKSVRTGSRGSRLDMMLSESNHQPTAPSDELTQYLDSDTVEVKPLSFWREHQNRFPALAALARDVLSVPATGAGVERLFNTARDICHYRRGRLNATTIQELMMFHCTSKFDIEEDEAVYVKEFLSHNEIEVEKEAKEDHPDELGIKQISDTEEGDDQERGGEGDEEGEDDETEATEPILPVPEGNTQVRASVRARKRTRREDDEFAYY